MSLNATLLPCWTTFVCQIPTNNVATSVYKYLEAFAKLEKRLIEGQEGAAATRGQLTIHDIRSKLDKFIKALGPSDLQVCVFTVVSFLFLTNKYLPVIWKGIPL